MKRVVRVTVFLGASLSSLPYAPTAFLPPRVPGSSSDSLDYYGIGRVLSAALRAAPQPGPGAAAAAAVREAQAANGTRERPLLLRRRCRQSDPDRLHPFCGGPPEDQLNLEL
ncbi:Hypothetical predicted protein [Marmota monax]|uniref:Uncharacterized protein n=1 Tax=Marmota monax TaxID=9995 RepID=A0A5E4CF51_MARMO|nr:Hypothetical predicted protein [Marmota monax]